MVDYEPGSFRDPDSAVFQQDGQVLRRQLGRELDPPGGGRGGELVEALFDQLRHVHRADVERLLPLLEAGDLQQVEDQLVEPVGLLLDAMHERQVVLAVVHGPRRSVSA